MFHATSRSVDLWFEDQSQDAMPIVRMGIAHEGRHALAVRRIGRFGCGGQDAQRSEQRNRPYDKAGIHIPFETVIASRMRRRLQWADAAKSSVLKM